MTMNEKVKVTFRPIGDETEQVTEFEDGRIETRIIPIPVSVAVRFLNEHGAQIPYISIAK